MSATEKSWKERFHQAIEEVANELMTLDDDAFFARLDKHGEGDIAQILQAGAAPVLDELCRSHAARIHISLESGPAIIQTDSPCKLYRGYGGGGLVSTARPSHFSTRTERTTRENFVLSSESTNNNDSYLCGTGISWAA